MNEGTEARQETPGRMIVTSVNGDTADEIELAALDAARECFGREVRLEVVRDYLVTSLGVTSGRIVGKKYTAHVKVRVA